MNDRRIEAALVAYLERLGSTVVTARDLVPFVRAVCQAPENARMMLPPGARRAYDRHISVLDPLQYDLFTPTE